MRWPIFSVYLVLLILISSLGVGANEDETTEPTSSMMPSFCNTPEECMSFCKENPGKCRFEFKNQMNDNKESIEIKSEFGELKYKYKSEFEGSSEIEVEYDEKDFHFDDVKPEFFIMGKMMEGLDAGQFEEFMQRCPDVGAMADGIIDKLKASGRWNIEKACDRLESEITNCGERAREGCENIKKGNMFRFDDSKINCGDDVSKDRFYNICISKKGISSGETFDPNDRCERDWDKMKGDCERRRDYCTQFNNRETQVQETEDREEDVESNEDEREDINVVQEAEVSPSSGSEREGMITTGMVVYSGSCDLGPSCERESFMKRCMEGMGGNVDTLREQTERNCGTMAEQMLENFRSNCEKRNFAYNNCIESTQKHCEPLTGAIERCKSINEDDIRSTIVKHGTKMCKFYVKCAKFDFAHTLLSCYSIIITYKELGKTNEKASDYFLLE